MDMRKIGSSFSKTAMYVFRQTLNQLDLLKSRCFFVEIVLTIMGKYDKRFSIIYLPYIYCRLVECEQANNDHQTPTILHL